jgi:hypothetical protein
VSKSADKAIGRFIGSAPIRFSGTRERTLFSGVNMAALRSNADAAYKKVGDLLRHRDRIATLVAVTDIVAFFL